MYMNNHFTFAENRKIQEVLNVLEDLAKHDVYFDIVLKEFNSAVGKQKIDMANYLLKTYNDIKDSGIMSLAMAIIISAY